MVGFAVLLISFPAQMSGMPAAPVSLFSVDATSAATLLDHSRILRIAGEPLAALLPAVATTTASTSPGSPAASG